MQFRGSQQHKSKRGRRPRERRARRGPMYQTERQIGSVMDLFGPGCSRVGRLCRRARARLGSRVRSYYRMAYFCESSSTAAGKQAWPDFFSFFLSFLLLAKPAQLSRSRAGTASEPLLLMLRNKTRYIHTAHGEGLVANTCTLSLCLHGGGGDPSGTCCMHLRAFCSNGYGPAIDTLLSSPGRPLTGERPYLKRRPFTYSTLALRKYTTHPHPRPRPLYPRP